MNDDRKAEIVRLARESWLANENLRLMGYINVPNDPEKAQEQAVAYALALAEAEDKRKELNDAIADARQIA